MKYKLLYLVLDGAGDSLNDPVTTLEASVKPGLDWVARNSKCGLMYTVGRGVAPESDEAVISILGYDPHEVYTGRGPLEALGAGLEFKEGYEVAFRANFATINPETMEIIDRRVGRSLTSQEARELARALDGLEVGVHEGYARVVATIGHRAVVVLGSRRSRLSGMVSNNDPAYRRQGLVSIAVQSPSRRIEEIKPLDNTVEARITAEIANAFSRKAVEILADHPVNLERTRRGLPPANAILLRDAGDRLPKAVKLPEKYGCRFAVLAEMPVEVGIGRAFGADTILMEPPSGDPASDYEARLKATLRALRDYDVVYVHLKGPDEPGHDGDRELKIKRIEEIDRFFVQPLLDELKERFALIVTEDHATPPSVRSHTDDPVPVAFYMPGIEPDGLKRFTEKECSRGSLGIIEHGWLLLPMIIGNYLSK
ncbi:MAG: 2,3-bisphosphoglycerate-independent phosphoglycerate mutase [Desulfurococcus sp.]|nr:2,3-bisphosphoglycerate-independent phosphoglycerate mutase [Desulfurococcus sp.]